MMPGGAQATGTNHYSGFVKQLVRLSVGEGGHEFAKPYMALVQRCEEGKRGDGKPTGLGRVVMPQIDIANQPEI